MKTSLSIVAALFAALVAPAAATGTVRIQQHDNSVQTYTGVVMKIVGRTLTLTSADGVSTVVISGGTCDRSTELIRCTGGGMSLKQDGVNHVIPFRSATFYFNLTDQDQELPLSTLKVAPHSVVFSAHTVKDTYITGTGKLDQEPPK
jgi:spore germination protein GerM